MIRSFKSTDIDEVMDIWLSGNIEAHPFVPEAYWRSNFLFVKEAILKSEVYVAESDNAVVGFIGLQDDFIAGLFIDRNFRSQGIGKQLLDKAKQHHDSLSLLVYADNIRAFAFYEREGFAAVRRSSMKKQITTNSLWCGLIPLRQMKQHDTANQTQTPSLDIPTRVFSFTQTFSGQ